MSEASRRVSEAARDASSNDDLVGNGFNGMMDTEDTLTSPLDEPTLDEAHSTQLGDVWDSPRRGAS